MRLLLCLILFLAACGKSNAPSYRIGIDPAWHAVEIPGKERNVTAFSTELLQEIARIKKLNLTLVDISWDNLLSDLKGKKYEGMLSSLRPYMFNEKEYSFSDLYVTTGPVLVVPVASSIHGLDMLSGKEIAVIRGSAAEMLLEKQPGVLIRIYDSIPQALNDVLFSVIDGALIPIIFASGYVHDLYQGMLKIATPPLNDEGIRLITLYDHSPELLAAFNSGLEELKKKGTYQKLAHKWELDFTE